MTDNQLIKKYIKERFPVGKEIYDPCRSGWPYKITERTVFQIFRWKKEDYNPDFLPDDPERYNISFSVKNPGKYSISYSLGHSTDLKSIRFYFAHMEKTKRPMHLREYKR